MQTYWSILEKVRGSTLRLTKFDDEIYEHLKRDFPEFDPAATIDEDAMKSKQGKERWRKFMMAYEKKVDDFNFGTLLRANPKWEYGNEETIFGALSAPRASGASRRPAADSVRSPEDAVLRHRDCQVMPVAHPCFEAAFDVLTPAQESDGPERLGVRAGAERKGPGRRRVGIERMRIKGGAEYA